MSYLRPTDAFISDTFQGHKNRKPPSGEPGVDYACGYGTDLVAPESGIVADLKHSTDFGTGRFLTLDLDDGRRVRWLHLSRINVGVGMRFERGQKGLARSGASAKGKEWGVGAHVHTTLFPNHSYQFSRVLDFELFVDKSSGAGQNVKPFEPEVIEERKDDDMWRVIESPAYKAAGKRVLMKEGVANEVPAGWVQNLVTHGRVQLASYPEDKMLIDELNFFYQWVGLDRNQSAEAAINVTKGVFGIEAATFMANAGIGEQVHL